MRVKNNVFYSKEEHNDKCNIALRHMSYNVADILPTSLAMFSFHILAWRIAYINSDLSLIRKPHSLLQLTGLCFGGRSVPWTQLHRL